MAKFIVLEGLDGSGKGTQTELLRDYLKKQGKRVRVIDFPDYNSEGCALVKMYLDGKLGSDHNALLGQIPAENCGTHIQRSAYESAVECAVGV